MRRREFIIGIGVPSLSVGCLRSLSPSATTTPTTTDTATGTPVGSPTASPVQSPEQTQSPPSTSESASTVNWSQYGQDAANTGYAPIDTVTEPGSPTRIVEGAVDGSTALFDQRLWIKGMVLPVPVEADTTGQDLVDQATHMAVHDGRVFMTGTGSDGVTGQLYSVTADGFTDGWAHTFEPVDDERTFAMGSPAVAGTTVYQATGDGQLRAVRTDDGSARWRYDLGSQRRLTPAVADETVFVTAADHTAALGPDGRPRWRQPFEFSSSPVVHDGLVLGFGQPTGDAASGLYAMNAADGTIDWSAAVGTLAYEGIRNLAVDGEYVYVNADSTLAAVALTDGLERWRRAFDGPGEVSVADSTVIALAKRPSGGTVSAFTSTSGELLWEQSLQTPVLTEPVLGDDRLYFGAGDGLYRLAESGG